MPTLDIMQRGILIVFPHRNLASHPTAVQIVRALSEVWSFVHFMSPKGDMWIRKGQDPTAVEPSMEKGSANPYRGMGRFRSLRQTYAKQLLANNRGKYAAVIGVDPEGLAHAHELNKHLQRPLVYASFELLFKNEVFTDSEKSLKNKEIQASRHVALALVQDELRERVLRENCEFKDTIFCHCPVAPVPAVVQKSTLLRDHLPIPSSSRIVLLAGSLMPFNSRDLLYEMVACWRDPFHLVLHSRLDLTPREKLFFQQLSSSTGRVSTTHTSVALENLAEVFSSADFALLPYLPDPSFWMFYQNVYHIGMSSGKAAYAAMCGLPMIASDLPTYKSLFSQISCGAVYSRVGEIPELLTALDSNYEFHSREARRCYEERMNPTEGLARFCKEVFNVANAAGDA